MRINHVIILVSIGCIALITGCAGKTRIEIQEKLMRMSDRELVDHYEMIEMRMIDIDRMRQQSIERWKSIESSSHPQKYYNHLEHLHIGDHWNELKKEKTLTLMEMKNRGISPP